jgi:hypothetical protein
MPRLALLLLALLLVPAAAGAQGVSGPDVPSLLGGETLRGTSAAMAWAGYSDIRLAYAQGVTARDDLGGQAGIDWATSELTIAAFWRRGFGKVGGWDLAGRLSVGWYLDGGSTLVHDDNQEDRGLLLAPSVLFSSRGAGLLALEVALPVVITTWRGGGVIVAPRVAASYEAALYDQVSLGLRGSLGWRGGSGGAPMPSGQVVPQLLVTATYKVF